MLAAFVWFTVVAVAIAGNADELEPIIAVLVESKTILYFFYFFALPQFSFFVKIYMFLAQVWQLTKKKNTTAKKCCLLFG